MLRVRLSFGTILEFLIFEFQSRNLKFPDFNHHELSTNIVLSLGAAEPYSLAIDFLEIFIVFMFYINKIMNFSNKII